MSEDTGSRDPQNPDGEQDADPGEGGDSSIDDLKRENEELKANNAKLFARAKKAEEKRDRDEPAARETPPEPKGSSSSGLSDDDVLFVASRGAEMTKERLDNLRKLAKAGGTSLEDAYADPMYQAYLASDSEKERKGAAGLKPSKRSAPGSSKVDFNDPEISDEDHRRAFQERVSG